MEFRQSLFWDVDPTTIDIQKNARYIIERILDFGTIEEVKWLAQAYPVSLIRDTLTNSRVIHEKSKALWSQVFR